MLISSSASIKLCNPHFIFNRAWLVVEALVETIASKVSIKQQ
jgi:hypothetical protein